MRRARWPSFLASRATDLPWKRPERPGSGQQIQVRGFWDSELTLAWPGESLLHRVNSRGRAWSWGAQTRQGSFCLGLIVALTVGRTVRGL